MYTIPRHPHCVLPHHPYPTTRGKLRNRGGHRCPVLAVRGQAGHNGTGFREIRGDSQEVRPTGHEQERCKYAPRAVREGVYNVACTTYSVRMCEYFNVQLVRDI